jgi:hypothetical protein
MWAAPFLLLAMDDRYPAVRHFAYRGLVEMVSRAEAHAPDTWALSRLPDFDYLAEALGAIDGARALLDVVARGRQARRRAPGDAVPLDGDLMPRRSEVAALTARQDAAAVSIGE